MADLAQLRIKTEEEIRDDFLRTYKAELIKRGIDNPNVSSGTEIYIKATSLAQQLSIVANNTVIKANAQMPDSAVGADLERLAKIYKLFLRSAGGSSGTIALSASISSPIPIPFQAQLQDDSGLSYQVSIGGIYSDGDQVPISSIDTGAATNLAGNSTLRWISPPPFVNPTAIITTGGLIGGIDAEDIEGLRTRLLERLRNPPGGGNWSQVAGTAEDSTVAVQKAFVYPACNGPATYGVAVVSAPTPSNKNRNIDPIVLATKIIPDIVAAFPEFAEPIITTVQNLPASVGISLALPSATTASIPGNGTGWTDANPFPIHVSTGFSAVTAVTNSTTFSVLSDIDPTAEVTQVCWISTDDWQLRTATVISFTTSGLAKNLVIDKPFVSDNGVVIAVGDYVFPNAVSMTTYVAALFNSFANMGPGEKTDISSLLPRAYRRPLVGDSYPASLNSLFLRRIIDSGEEVFQADYTFRSIITPPVPALITDAPFQIVPDKIGFYPSQE